MIDQGQWPSGTGRPAPSYRNEGQSNLQNLSGSREHLIWGARSGAGGKCRNIWKIRMMSLGKVQPTADTDSQVVTDNIGPRLDDDRVAPNATGADIGRPSRSGDQWHDSESEDETMYENRSRQRDDNREDMSGSEVEGQERHERGRRNATREDLSRQVVPEVGIFVGEQVPIPGRVLSSMSLDRLEQGTYRRLTAQCFSDSHIMKGEFVARTGVTRDARPINLPSYLLEIYTKTGVIPKIKLSKRPKTLYPDRGCLMNHTLQGNVQRLELMVRTTVPQVARGRMSIYDMCDRTWGMIGMHHKVVNRGLVHPREWSACRFR